MSKAKFGHLLVRGALREFGYSIHLPEEKRREILKKAVKKYGGLSVFRKLNAVATLQKNVNPQISKRFKADAEWVKRMFYGTPQWQSRIIITTKTRKKLARERKLNIQTIKRLLKLLKVKKLDPDLRVVSGYLYSKDYRGEGLIRVNVFEKFEFPEFAIYISKRTAKPGVHNWDKLLTKAGFHKENENKFVIRGDKYNLFVYFV